MTIQQLNNLLSQLPNAASRDKATELAKAIMQLWGINAEAQPRVLGGYSQVLQKMLAENPRVKNQPLLYQLSSNNLNIVCRFAVVKKINKNTLHRLCYIEQIGKSWQHTISPAYDSLPYYIDFITTEKFNAVTVVVTQGEQIRTVTFKDRITNLQHNKILPVWQNIIAKPKAAVNTDLWSSLDLKSVNKEFYISIKQKFDGLIAHIKEQYPHASANEQKMFAIRMIGRYLFCWFLKEKEIIHPEVLGSASIAKYKSRINFYNLVTRRLFFDTLNTLPYPTRTFPANVPAEMVQHFHKIPYLNGGLFEPSEEDKIIGELSVDDWLESFVRVLEDFNFTVDESSSNYEQVAIDPEMLGRILENLLASLNPETEKMANERKALGAFYTPRPIVDYMVTESLKAFCTSQFDDDKEEEEKPFTINTGKPNLFSDSQPKQIAINIDKLSGDKQQKEKLKEKIEKLFDFNTEQNPFTATETQKLRQKLNECKIIDPACGSGAFPMGVLHKLESLHEKLGTDKSSYELRRTILSKNIYGVDILPIAVEISRLRAWLALVLVNDYKVTDAKHNFGIKALPNLDFKFVTANSLINSGYDEFVHLVDKANISTLQKLDSEIQQLERIKSSYFDSSNTTNNKKNLVTEFRKKKEYIKNEFAQLKKNYNLESFLQKVDDWDPFNDGKASSFFSSSWMFSVNDGFDIVIGNPPYVGQKGNKEMFQLIKKSALGQKYHQRRMDLFYFFFHFGLLNLKHKGILSFITTNYFLTATYSDKLRKHLFEESSILRLLNFNELKIFESATGQHNLITILMKGKFAQLFANTSITSRNGLASNNTLRNIFNENDSETSFYKQPQEMIFENKTLYIRIEPDNNIFSKKTSGQPINIHSILNRIRILGTPLDTYIDITTGIQSSSDKVTDSFIKKYPSVNGKKGEGIYILTNKEIEEKNFSAADKAYLKKTYKNSDLKKWIFFPDNDLNVLYIKSTGKYFELSKGVKKHFDKFKLILINRNVRAGSVTEKDYQNYVDGKIEISYIMNASSMKNGNYYCLSYARGGANTFEVPKIVNSRRANSNIFALEEKGYYEQSDIVVSTLKKEYENEINIKYLLAVLNSRLIYYWFYYKGKRKGEALELFQKPISEVPIIHASKKIQEAILNIVNQILTTRKNNHKAPITSFEKTIDIMIYHLYKLTYEEAKIVDPELSEENFKKYTIIS